MRVPWNNLHASCLLALLMLSLGLTACGGAAQPIAVDNAPAFSPVAPAVARPPGFPSGEQPASPSAPQQVRTASGTLLTLTGAAFNSQSGGSSSYAPDASGKYVFSPAQGSADSGSASQHQAWGIYRFDGLDSARPQELDTDVSSAGATLGAPVADLTYYLGVANYTRGAWDWFGPLKQDAKLTLNAPAKAGAPAITERYINATGTLYACLLVDSSKVAPDSHNLQGRAAVQLTTITLNTAALLTTTKPLLLQPAGWKTGSSARLPEADKRTSALQPTQFPVVNWTLATEDLPQYILCQAQTVRVYRQGPTDAAPLLVGEVAAQQQQFTDPLDCSDGVPSAAGGTTYRYLLQAVNSAGVTPPAATDWFTVPMLPPQSLQATQDLPGGTGTQVSWLACDGAVRYHIGRGATADGSQSVEIGNVDAPTMAYLDTTALPGQYYWYFVRAEGPGDGNAANGLETGALSALSSPAEGLRGYALTLKCTTAGVSGDGSAASPYLLTAGQTYQFTVTDQNNNALTAFAAFSVAPPASASFGSPPGTLSGIAPGAGAFTASASFAYQGFTWTADAQCVGN